MVSGASADIRAYGFSGNKPYHFSSKYLIPCAVKIESGSMKNMIALELKPVIIIQNRINSEAMEFRDAKNPFVVEKSPVKASTKVGRDTSGDKNMFSML